ncbi:glycosyltransferase [Salinisphaera sp. G21_0]|uniref:glycosyltransferase n=1 Tax=Salinisphaera sp. G21_0 TaxID=2821094 RepID=UPI001ADB8808|nr:glycosyltransferase [Salinisphaera sp. G21_0]MBO9480326.1 glycosyltransferase [Salinisphaera sp. G21_0]
MKLLVVIPSLHRGGAERVVSLLSEEWAKEHTVKIAVFDASNTAYTYGGDLVDLELSANRGWLGKGVQAIRRVVSLARLFREVKPDRVISFMESANFPCILAGLIAGVRSRLWVSVRNDPGRFPFFYQQLIPLFYRMPDKVVAVSSGVAQALSGIGVPERRLISIPNPAPTLAPTLATPLSKPTDAPDRYILGVGRLHWQKGFDRLMTSFTRLDDKNVHLVILGEGNMRKALESQAATLGISDRLYMPGAQENLWPWYRHALCFVLSSRHEGWPNVLMEAMSQKCPLVAFDCNYGPSEIIENGISGWLVNDGSVNDLAEALQEVINNSAQRRQFGEQSLMRVVDFEVTKIARKWLL